MNQLIKIETNENGEQLVSGRELHEFLEVQTEYKDWFPRMIKYGFEEDKDFSSFLSESTGGRPRQDHAMQLDMAKEISMIQRTDKGKEARQYFVDVEKQYKQTVLDTSNLSPELQMFNGLFKALANQELATNRIETKVDNISSIVGVNSTNWKEDSNRLINKIVRVRGNTPDEHREVRSMIFEEIDKRAGVSLKTRLTYKRRRMADEGAAVSKRNKLNKVDVISDDKKLIEIYVAVVKEFAIKYGVWQEIA